jgi:hypothetical protein
VEIKGNSCGFRARPSTTNNYKNTNTILTTHKIKELKKKVNPRNNIF